MRDLLETAIDAATDAGSEVMRLYESTDFERKNDGSPVTLADTRANEVITAKLEATGIAMLSEESASIGHPYPERLWVIDPLDGTRDFIAKSGDFAVMVGLVENGRPVLGAVFLPVMRKLYFAERGGGAYGRDEKGERRLSVSARTEDLRFVRSGRHVDPRFDAVAKRLAASVTARGSIGVKAGLIAEDESDFLLSWGKLGEWDVCAPEIILTEAGGEVTDAAGQPLRYGNPDHRIQNGMVFSNHACHERVLRAISEVNG
ncbi:MAG TPA: 3'(2'),5'-bisphosphate nucleotidase CysQ [Candidatus Paceibacterota bacterium]|nr:3'(2'),5'-bisphosphate nucleotidase CysQ [Candidatus Paceibacterota bacterium]